MEYATFNPSASSRSPPALLSKKCNTHRHCGISLASAIRNTRNLAIMSSPPSDTSTGIQSFTPNRELLVELANTRMPFGKYAGRLLVDLPSSYLCWFARKGFPPGKLGMLLESALEIKTNGLAPLLKPLVDKSRT